MICITQKEKSRQIAVRLTPIEYDRIMEMIDGGLYRSSADFARDAIRDKIRTLEVVSVKDVSLQEAKKMILIYLKKNPDSHFASEIANELGMDYGVAFGAVNQLLESGKIRRSKVR
jgi:Arc/MetJ-type ribon-helix-helix transcriptional regulator